MEPVRIAVLGLADIARRRMIPAMAASRDVSLVAVASRDPARAHEAARAYGCRALPDYQAALKSAEVDAVYIPLPTSLHTDWAEEALHAGKHVLVEKPAATSYRRAVRLAALARVRRLALMENIMFIHHPQHREVLRMVSSGAIGELRSFRADFTVPRRPDGDIRLRPELGGGALWDTGVYPLRAALYFLGPRLRVLAASASTDLRAGVDTAGAVLLGTPAGASVQLGYGIDHAYRSRYELCGSEGRLTVDRAFTPSRDHQPVLRLERPAGTEEIVLTAQDQAELTLSAFARRCHETPGPVPGGTALSQLLGAVRRLAGLA
jgi:predicted dehydrogenase